MNSAIRPIVVIMLLAVALSMRTAWGSGEIDGLEDHDVKLSVGATNAPGSSIGIDLEYIGRTPIHVYKSDLPWGIRRSMILVAMCLDGADTLIPELEYIDDPAPDIVTLGPGQKLHGTIRLEERFSTFRDCLKTKDALVFWSYQLSPIDAAPTARVSGGIIVRKRQPQSR